MLFSGLAITTADVPRLARFYAEVFNTEWDGDDIHTVINAPGISFPIYAKHAAERDMLIEFPPGWGAGSVTLCFDVGDVDAEYARLLAMGVEFAAPPRTYPWGARSMHFRDPDGNVVCFRKAAEG